MNTADSTEGWLNAVAAGDDAALDRAARMYEPVLRMMVRRHLPRGLWAKFDSADIVQSVWGQLLVGFREGRWRFPTRDHLRAFLVRAAQNRLIDRSRQQTGAARHGPAAGPPLEELPSATPPPGAGAEAEELWERLWRTCPERHRAVLVLKRQGRSLDEIAAHTGLHKSSVRRLLYALFSGLENAREPEGPK